MMVLLTATLSNDDTSRSRLRRRPRSSRILGRRDPSRTQIDLLEELFIVYDNLRLVFASRRRRFGRRAAMSIPLEDIVLAALRKQTIRLGDGLRLLSDLAYRPLE